ncbi:fungal-specific transcription factor domain-containing protein [Blakeslea trispora]|nr:fungal-specific transcription factor domain-containing protein [Blakeslea trispora]
MDDSSPPTPELPERKSHLPSTSGIKRNKVSRACDECRKRKVRCDGAQPCARCQKSSTECVFSNVTPKRGPPKQYLEPFESRLKAIDAVLQALEISSKKTSSPENDCFLKTSGPVVETNTHLDVTYTGQALYIQDNPMRLDRIEPIHHVDLGQEHHTPLQLTLPAQGSPNFSNIRFDLIQLYFDHIHPSLPFASRSLFTQSQPPILLLYSIYAVASKFLAQQPNSNEPPGWSYYTAALGSLDILLDVPRLSTVQALLLLAKYHEFVYRPGFFWRTKFFVQLAMQMASNLGLPRSLPNNLESSISRHQLEARSRTFWAVYTYHVLMSIEQGLELNLQSQECTVNYPHVLSDEFDSDVNAVLDFYWLSKVVHVQAAVIQFLRNRLKDTTDKEMDQFRDIENMLMRIEASMPHVENSNKNASFVQLMYHLTSLLLYRPYASIGNNDSCSPSVPHAASRCLNSASSMAKIIDQVLTRYGSNAFNDLTRSNQQIVYCLSVAITVVRELQRTHHAHEVYEKISSLLQLMATKSPATEIETPPSNERPDLQVVSPSTTSSTRSSPLIPSLSPHSPTPAIKKRHSRSSLQFPISDNVYGLMAGNSNNNATTPEMITHRRRPTGRSPYAANRLSAPALGSLCQQSPYFYQQIQQQQQQQMQQQGQSYSQPSSPITNQFGDNLNTPSHPTALRRTTSLSRKAGLRRSASSIGDFGILPQRLSRTTSRPYINPRRHTLTNTTPPDLSHVVTSPSSIVLDMPLNLHAMAVRNNQFSTSVMNNNTQHPFMIPILNQQQNQYPNQQQSNHHHQGQQSQHLVLDPSSFPMDPVIPDSPNDSMMNLLLNPWDFSSQPPSS